MIMIEQGRSSAEAYLVDMIQNRQGEFATGAVAAPFFSLCDKLAGAAPQGVKVYQAALLHSLKEAGWIDRGRIMSRELTTKKQIYCAPELMEVSRSELRRMVEEPPVPMRIVK